MFHGLFSECHLAVAFHSCGTDDINASNFLEHYCKLTTQLCMV